MADMTDVSIVIVNYNTSKLILNCIDSIRNYTHGVSYEIIIVDNNSTNDSYIENLKKIDGIKYIQSSNNLGFGRANNLGAANAIGQYLFFLNPDTLLINNAIFELWKYMVHNKQVAVVGGNLYNKDMQPTHSFRRFFPSMLIELDYALNGLLVKRWYGKGYEFNNTSVPLPVAYVTGADLMIRRTVWDDVDGFDPSFFMYYEETDLVKRVSELYGCNGVMCLPTAKIQHLEGMSFEFSESREKRIQNGRFLYFYKHYSLFYNMMCNIVNITTLLLAIWIYKVLKNKKMRKYSCRYRIYINEMRKKIQEYNEKKNRNL